MQVWHHFVQLARNAPGALAVISMLVLYITATCLRFRHAQRHRFLHDMCGPRLLVGEVSRGKGRRRAAFRVAGPTHAAPDDSMFQRLYRELLACCPDATFLVPDTADHRGRALDGSVPLLPRPMSYNKFMACLRALVMAPPLAL